MINRNCDGNGRQKLFTIDHGVLEDVYSWRVVEFKVILCNCEQAVGFPDTGRILDRNCG